MLEEVSAGAFRVLLEFLYASRLPEEDGFGQGLGVGEMAKVADRFQAAGLYEHCVQQFKEGIEVGNVVERLVQAHDSRLAVLEEAAMRYFKANALAFQVCCCFVQRVSMLFMCNCCSVCCFILVNPKPP